MENYEWAGFSRAAIPALGLQALCVRCPGSRHLVPSELTREITAVILTASKNFNVGLHSHVNEPIWFRHCVMIGAIELDI